MVCTDRSDGNFQLQAGIHCWFEPGSRGDTRDDALCTLTSWCMYAPLLFISVSSALDQKQAFRGVLNFGLSATKHFFSFINNCNKMFIEHRKLRCCRELWEPVMGHFVEPAAPPKCPNVKQDITFYSGG